MQTLHAGQALRASRAWDDAWLDRWGLPCVLAAGALLLFVALGVRDLSSPDEPRYAAIAEELRSFVHGWRGLVLLHLNGEVYTQKPPLYFWLEALCGVPLDRVTETAARLPSALAGFATLALVAGLGRSLFRPASGLLAAAVLMTVPAWLGHARSARLDALLTAEVTLALWAAWRIERGTGSVRHDRMLLHAAVGLGVLTKGPAAALVPGLGLVSFLAWERRLADLRRYVTPASLGLSLLPGLAWIAAATLWAPPGYLHESLWRNLVSRFLVGSAQEHVQPAWYYATSLPAHFLPWSLLWPWVALRLRSRWRAADDRERRAWRFLLATCAATFVFFSLAAGKRNNYLLPIYPLLALACGETLAGWAGAARTAPAWSKRALAGGVAAAALLGFAALGGERVGALALPDACGWLVVGGAAGALLLEDALRPRRGERGALVGAALCVLVACQLAVAGWLSPALGARDSPRPLLALAAARTPPGESIGVLADDNAAAAVAYYARRPVRPLREPRDLADFLDRGGHSIVADARYLEPTRTQPLREVARSGEGRRAYVLMTRKAE